MADRSEAVSAVSRAILRGLVVQTDFFSVDHEKVVHWTDVGGEVLIQGQDSFDLASFFIDMLGSCHPELALEAANDALSGTAPEFERPDLLHYSDPGELFEEPPVPASPPQVSDSNPPSTLRAYPDQH